MTDLSTRTTDDGKQTYDDTVARGFCLAPVVKDIHEGIGIRHGVIATIHDITNTQTVVDAPHKDLRRARASSLSLIPTSTGSATTIALICPELEGKLSGIAVRVPLLNASLTDCVFEVVRATTAEEVNGLLAMAASEGPLKGILGYEERPLVSVAPQKRHRGGQWHHRRDHAVREVVGDERFDVGHVVHERLLELAGVVAAEERQGDRAELVHHPDTQVV
jgi:glyceraldehyde-3-phosphate dehydrogenase type I